MEILRRRGTQARQIPWPIGVILAVVLGLAMLYSGPQSPVTSESRKAPLDITKPVYLAKDAVECSILTAVFPILMGNKRRESPADIAP